MTALEMVVVRWVQAEAFLAEYLLTGKAKVPVMRKGQCVLVEVVSDKIIRKPCP